MLLVSFLSLLGWTRQSYFKNSSFVFPPVLDSQDQEKRYLFETFLPSLSLSLIFHQFNSLFIIIIYVLYN